jgi:molybdopterin-guanine dinucleotide biosynthesis protein A
MIDSGLYGLILAGGKSTRMGTDKALTNFHGLPQEEYLAKLLRNFCDRVFLSRTKNEKTFTKTEIIEDLYTIQSPLNGILSAYHTFPGKSWLIVPVDMPNVDQKLLGLLISSRNTSTLATCFTDSTSGKPEPLVGIWEPAAALPLKTYYESGGLSPREFLERNRTQLINPPHADYLLNINTPEEFAKFRKNLTTRGS